MKTVWKTGAVAALAMGSVAGFAQQPMGPYIGVLAGTTDISREVTDDYTYKADKFTWGATLGWQLHQFVAVEAGYLRPKKSRETISDGVDTADITARFHGLTASALLTWPISERWSTHLRLGAVRASEKYSASLNGGAPSSFTDNTTEVLYGAGLSVGFEDLRLRLDYQRAKFNYGKVGLLALGINWFLPTGN